MIKYKGLTFRLKFPDPEEDCNLDPMNSEQNKKVDFSWICIKSIHEYEPVPDYELVIREDGSLLFTGNYFVSVTGTHLSGIPVARHPAVLELIDLLTERVVRNHRKADPGSNLSIQTARRREPVPVGETDYIARDYIRQIIQLAGVDLWIDGELHLYLVLTRVSGAHKELAVVQAAGTDFALDLYRKNRWSDREFTAEDFHVIRMGTRVGQERITPAVLFSFDEESKRKRPPLLKFNDGPEIKGSGPGLNLFLYVSFGKRYNDPAASYFLVAAETAGHARQIFQVRYPHFMPGDFQITDLQTVLKKNPLFTHSILLSLR